MYKCYDKIKDELIKINDKQEFLQSINAKFKEYQKQFNNKVRFFIVNDIYFLTK